MLQVCSQACRPHLWTVRIIEYPEGFKAQLLLSTFIYWLGWDTNSLDFSVQLGLDLDFLLFLNVRSRLGTSTGLIRTHVGSTSAIGEEPSLLEALQSE